MPSLEMIRSQCADMQLITVDTPIKNHPKLGELGSKRETTVYSNSVFTDDAERCMSAGDGLRTQELILAQEGLRWSKIGNTYSRKSCEFALPHDNSAEEKVHSENSGKSNGDLSQSYGGDERAEYFKNLRCGSECETVVRVGVPADEALGSSLSDSSEAAGEDYRHAAHLQRRPLLLSGSTDSCTSDTSVTECLAELCICVECQSRQKPIGSTGANAGIRYVKRRSHHPLMKTYSNPTPVPQTSRIYFMGTSEDSKLQKPRKIYPNLTAKQMEYVNIFEKMCSDDDFDNRYELRKQLTDSGAVDQVGLAMDRSNKSLVTVKVVNVADHSENLFVLAQEMAAISRLRHENLVRFVDCFFSSESLKLHVVAESLDGCTLRNLLETRSVVPNEETIAAIAKQCVSALQAMHQFDFVYREVNSENVHVTKDGAIKLSNVGFCSHSQHSSANEVAGLPELSFCTMAPEMIKRKPYTAKVDVWGIGILVYELAHGRPPFHELSPRKAMAKVAKSGVKACTQKLTASPELNHFLERSLKRRQLKRASMDEIARHPFLRKAGGFSCIAMFANAVNALR